MRHVFSGVLAVVGTVGLATAQDALVTFGFTDLNGSFASTGRNQGIFTATSTTGTTLDTSGDVSRGGVTADFDAGTMGAPGTSMFMLSLAVSNITTTSAFATGSFEIIDANGDTLSGTVEGSWSFNVFGLAFFNGSTTGVSFTQTPNSNGAFDGASGGSFGIDDLHGLFDGGLSVLFLRNNGLRSAFTGVSTQADGLIVPAPASLAGLAVFGITAARRRRG